MLINTRLLAFPLFFFTKLKKSLEHLSGGPEGDCNHQTGGKSPREEVGPKDTGQLLLDRTPNEASLVLSGPTPALPLLAQVVAPVWVLGPSLWVRKESFLMLCLTKVRDLCWFVLMLDFQWVGVVGNTHLENLALCGMGWAGPWTLTEGILSTGFLGKYAFLNI